MPAGAGGSAQPGDWGGGDAALAIDELWQDSSALAEAPAGGLNDCDVEAEYEALEKSLKDDGVEDSKGDDATTTLPALPNVPTMPPVALPPPPGTKAAKSCAA